MQALVLILWTSPRRGCCYGDEYSGISHLKLKFPSPSTPPSPLKALLILCSNYFTSPVASDPPCLVTYLKKKKPTGMKRCLRLEAYSQVVNLLVESIPILLGDHQDCMITHLWKYDLFICLQPYWLFGFYLFTKEWCWSVMACCWNQIVLESGDEESNRPVPCTIRALRGGDGQIVPHVWLVMCLDQLSYRSMHACMA